MSKSELDPPMARAALAFGVGALFGVLTLGANLARADTALPPRAVVRESDPRCEKLNSAMVRLKEVHRVPIRIIYSDTASIQIIIIPKLHESKARTAGMMELTDEEIVFEIVGDPEYSGSVRTVLAGAALSLGFIAVGIWLAAQARAGASNCVGEFRCDRVGRCVFRIIRER